MGLGLRGGRGAAVGVGVGSGDGAGSGDGEGSGDGAGAGAGGGAIPETVIALPVRSWLLAEGSAPGAQRLAAAML